MKRPLITLLTDFGQSDHYVAVMKGVMLGIAPDAQFVDISHEIGAYSVAEAAFTLAQAAPWFPRGTVHLVVVDPGVGSARRPIISKAAGHYFVGPDNGILTAIWDADTGAKLWEISPPAKLPSATFHGRDIFAPTAARLASGIAPRRLGRRTTAGHRLATGTARRTEPGAWSGEILRIDRFGNAITSLPASLWTDVSQNRFVLTSGRRKIRQARAVYSDGLPSELFVICGSTGFLEIAANQASAASLGRLSPGNRVSIKIG